MSVVVDRYLGRTRAAEHLVEDWKIKHDEAMIGADVEEIVRECVDLGALCQHAWKSLWQFIRRDPNSDVVDESANVMRTALAKTLQVLQSVTELVAEANSKGFAISGSEKLDMAAGDVREVSAKVESLYPPPMDPVQAEEAIAAFKRGEYVTIEELIREAQTGTLSTD